MKKKNCIINEEQIEKWLCELTLDEKISLCTGKNFWQSQDIERLNIPSFTMSDGTSGVRFQKDSKKDGKVSFIEAIKGSFDSEDALENTYPATCFPSGSAIACSWDRELLREVGRTIARECRELGIDILLGPGVNIRRHPLTARNYEYYSEDPYLAGELASEMIIATQEEGIGTCLKHFACHNSDSFRTRVNVNVSERALREIYLSCFERAIKKSKPISVMSAYNKVNGKEVSGNSRLVKNILKSEWDYDGLVITDWGAVKNIEEATKGKIDLQMPHCEASSIQLRQAIDDNRISIEELDERVRRILKTVIWVINNRKERKKIDFKVHHKVAQKAAVESAVLLKNENNILPITDKKYKKIAVVGRLAKYPVYQGSGCAIVHAKQVDEPYDCLKENCPDSIEMKFAAGYDQEDIVSEMLLQDAVNISKKSDAVILFVGSRMPDESDDYNKKNICIEPGHQILIEEITKVNKNVIVVLASGEVLEMPWRNNVKAILEMWYAGEGMGDAAAQLLFGKKNPSGRLSATIPVKLSDTPAYLSFTGNTFDMTYGEDIYVGYRYYDKKQLEPAYPFGFGLSYTRYKYKNLKLSTNYIEDAESFGKIKVSVDVENNGEVEGKETVQLYISQNNPKLPRPVRELKGFEQVTLQPGECKEVCFTLEGRDFSYYNDKVKDFVIDSDIFNIEIGSSSRDIKKKSTLEIKKGSKINLPLRWDCGFTELFENQENMKAFDDFLERSKVIENGQANDLMHRQMEKSFWSIGSYLDMNCNGEISWEMVKDFIKELNDSRIQ